mmetsp:Transcript_21395/g.21030  ORF Transcript_21395/g.21030 Transcript_21395/m.21030 type:complete len:365 (-) Transcript_21395:23-1117(-)
MKAKESTSKLKEETKQAVVETENSGIYPELQEKLNTLSEKLFNARKEHKKPEGYIKGTDFSTLTEKNSYPFHSTTTPGAASVDISKKNPNILCSGGNDGSTIIFDKTSGKVTHNFGDNSNSSPVNGVEFMDSGVLLSKANGSAEYWAVDLVSQTSTHMKTIQGQAGIIASSHPLNPYVIHGTGSNSWGFFNIETGAKLFQTELKDGMDLTSLRVHPDGLMVATGSSTGVVNLWDIRTQSCAAVMEGINSPITRLEFSEKAIHLAGSSDKSNIAGLWNLKKFKKPPQKLIHQQGSVVRSIAFDPYGAFVVSASDKTLCFFDSSNTETCLFELPAHEDVINDVSFALDASYLATASADRTVKLFQL